MNQVLVFCICISPFGAAQINPSDCGTNDLVGSVISVRVVGGRDVVGPGRWPWACSVGFFEGSTWSHKCGGSLITYRDVVTAAHCVADSDTNNWKMSVRCGDFNLVETDDDMYSQTQEVSSYERYREYKLLLKNDDIAVLKLQTRLVESPFVRPICLTESNASPITALIVVGWGTDNDQEKSTPSDILRQSIQQKLDSTFCMESLAENRVKVDFPNGLFKGDVFCAADPTGIQSGACQGDSGGPIFFFNSKKRRYELVGIVNSGYSCGRLDSPDIYTSSTHPPILDFIRKTVAVQG